MYRVGLAALTLGLGLTGCTDDGTVTTESTDTAATVGSSSGSTTAQATSTTASTVPTTTEPTSTMGSGSDTMGNTGTGTSTSGSTSTTTETSGGSTSTTTGDVSASSSGGTTGVGSSSGSSTTGELCPDGTILCEGKTTQTCDGVGGFKDVMDCPVLCLPDIGCADCMPGATQCAGKVAQKCDDLGKWQDLELCDDVQGLMCDAQLGQCVGACAANLLGNSYIGCDYYPTTLANLHETQPWNFHYAVVVANTTNAMANITITQGANAVTNAQVGPGTAKVINLPYVNALVKPTINEPGPSLVVTDGAYRLRSNQPVTVYQYEPIEYTLGGLFSYTNDASLLLPVNTWTGNYIVASRNHWFFNNQYNLPGFYAVVARLDNTKVTLKPSATGGLVNAGGGVAGNGTGVVMLNEGDVLEVFTISGGGIPDLSDLTGTIINADKPVQVFGGHKCTQVPVGTQACDRLEEAMLPIETLSKKYIVTPPLIPTGGNVPKAQMVRVIATEDATTINYDPAQPGAPTMIAKAGDWFEIAKNVNDFQIVSDKKILVSQYMQGQQAGGNSGDPAMALAVATEQYRTKYLVHAPINYESNFVNITAPMDAKVTLDGVAVPALAAIGATGFGVVRVKMGNNVDGNHDLLGDKPFGVSVYGYGQYTSYWYPGGLDLEALPQ
jgi:hypothetical protein